MLNIFTKEFLKEIGFKQEFEYEEESFSGDVNKYKVEEPYGRAIDIKTNGIMTVLKWNNEGHSVTYFGDELEVHIKCINELYESEL